MKKKISMLILGLFISGIAMFNLLASFEFDKNSQRLSLNDLRIGATAQAELVIPGYYSLAAYCPNSSDIYLYCVWSGDGCIQTSCN
ncbi:MAG: hypothetical protein RLO81_05690 [Fulvivirga sp.]|uniref:hypothetical protein n=1 Tax=Fulvivirga sp. TaxID=1931237 RepID=UPI0032EAEE75